MDIETKEAIEKIEKSQESIQNGIDSIDKENIPSILIYLAPLLRDATKDMEKVSKNIKTDVDSIQVFDRMALVAGFLYLSKRLIKRM